MNVTLSCGARHGSVTAPPSKSDLHRKLICAALADAPSKLLVSGLSDDISATVRCLNALGASISETADGVFVTPISQPPAHAVLDAGESGSTLRFLLPVCGALGVSAELLLSGRLPQRPMEPLIRVLSENGMKIERKNDVISCSGKLQAGRFSLPGSVSSQFLSGLLFALPLLAGESVLSVSLPLVSGSYFEMTKKIVSASLLHPLFRLETATDNCISCYVNPSNSYHVPAVGSIEADWSGAAAFACMGALSETGISLCGLDRASLQPDRAIVDILLKAGAVVRAEKDRLFIKKGALRSFTFDAAPCPDLVPVLAVFACACEGVSELYNAARLRQKESDRLLAVSTLIKTLGGNAEQTPDGLRITGRPIHGGTVSSFSDHRIAMAAAVAACIASSSVTVEGCEAVCKSYPSFWRDFETLKGAI